MSSLPTGTVTFLKTDIENSNRLGGRQDVFDRHGAIIHRCAQSHSGTKFYDGGDGDGFVFEEVASALKTAAEIQQLLQQEDWGALGSLESEHRTRFDP